jgi:hypothetical protein
MIHTATERDGGSKGERGTVQNKTPKVDVQGFNGLDQKMTLSISKYGYSLACGDV